MLLLYTSLNIWLVMFSVCWILKLMNVTTKLRVLESMLVITQVSLIEKRSVHITMKNIASAPFESMIKLEQILQSGYSCFVVSTAYRKPLTMSLRFVLVHIITNNWLVLFGVWFLSPCPKVSMMLFVLPFVCVIKILRLRFLIKSIMFWF